MKTIGIIYNSRIPEALDLSTAIVHELSLEQASWISPAENLDALRERVPDTDLVITAGGDGTILRAVRVTAPSGIPLVGINMGRLGFMTELQVHDALEKLPIYLDGGCRVAEHNMIQATVIKGKGNTGSEAAGPYHALNDVVLSPSARVGLHLEGTQEAMLSVDGFFDRPLAPGDWVKVKQSPLKTRFLRA